MNKLKKLMNLIFNTRFHLDIKDFDKRSDRLCNNRIINNMLRQAEERNTCL